MILATFARYRVEFVPIEGRAVLFHGASHTTDDVDFVIRKQLVERIDECARPETCGVSVSHCCFNRGEPESFHHFFARRAGHVSTGRDGDIHALGGER